MTSVLPLPPSRIETSASILSSFFFSSHPRDEHPREDLETATSTQHRPHVKLAESVAVGHDRAAVSAVIHVTYDFYIFNAIVAADVFMYLMEDWPGCSNGSIAKGEAIMLAGTVSPIVFVHNIIDFDKGLRKCPPFFVMITYAHYSQVHLPGLCSQGCKF
jgi:hypothetical protein